MSHHSTEAMVQRPPNERLAIPHWQITQLYQSEAAPVGGRRGVSAVLWVAKLPGLDAIADVLANERETNPAFRAALDLAEPQTPCWSIEPTAFVDRSSRICPVHTIDLTTSSGPDHDELVQGYLDAAVREPFDVRRPPLVRVAAIALADGHGLVQVVGHPALFDRRSIAAVLERVAGADTERVEVVAETHRFDQPTMTPSNLSVQDWATDLAGTPPAAARFWATPPLPSRIDADHGRSRSGAITLTIDGRTVERLRQMADRCDTVLDTLLFAVHSRAVAAATGRTDVIIGLEHRFADAGTSTLGSAHGLLPVRAALPSGDWEALVRRFVKDYRSAARFSHLSFLSLQRHLGVDLVVDATVAIADDRTTTNVPFAGTALTQFVLDRKNGTLKVLVTGNGELTDEQVGELARLHHAALIHCADAGPHRELASITAEQSRTVLKSWNGPVRHYPVHLRVHQLVEQQTDRTPDAVAVDDGQTRLTYRDLDVAANRLANRLRASGAGRGTTVAVLGRRDAALIAVFLGVLKAGAAYLPIEPAQPVDRIAYLLQDSGASIVLTDDEYHATVPTGPWTVLRTDRHDDGPSGRPEVEGTPADLMYVIYTSGSTGNPKGVEVPHSGVVNYLGWCREAYASKGSGGAALFSSVAFDMVVPNIYTPLIMGQRVYVAHEGLSMESIAERLAEQAPFSFLKLTPGQLAVLAELLPPQAARQLAEKLVVGADAFPLRVLNAWRRIDPATSICNEYGPTEASVGNSVYDVAGSETGDALPIGRPIPNTTMYVLDPDRYPVPVGVPGELYIGGACVVRGYVGLPEVTAARFIDDVLTDTGSATMYRTGDVGRWLPDGNLEFLGRIDEQVKIRGYRVEPAEVEAAMVSHPHVPEAVVTAAGATRETLALIGYYTHDTDLPPAQLRDYLAARLPDYLVPQAFIPIEAVPLTKNGKVDRKALPAPDFGRSARRRQAAALAGPAGEVIDRVWREIFAGALPGPDHRLDLAPGSQLTLASSLSRDGGVPGSTLFPMVLMAATVGDLADRLRAAIPVVAQG